MWGAPPSLFLLRIMDYIGLHLARLNGRTRENRGYLLSLWARYLAERDADPISASRQDIEEWIARRRDAGISGRTIRSDLSHLRVWYRWLVEVGARGDDPTVLIRAPRVGITARPWLGREDAARLLDASLTWEGGELAAQVHLWLLSGLRPGEPRGLRVTDLGTRDQAVTLAVSATKTPGREIITLPPSTAGILARHAEERMLGPLLCNPRTGQAWTKACERARFQRLLRSAGVPRCTPYGLRVSMITLALAAGVSERDVSIAARHTSSAQTAHYDRLRTHAERPVAPQLEAWLQKKEGV